MGKSNTRQMQAIHTKNKIFETAIALIEQNGFENTFIEDICKEAGVAVGSFYRYFGSKFDILVEQFKRADVYFDDEVRKNLDAVSGRQKLLLYFDYYAKYTIHTKLDITKQFFNPNHKLFSIKGRIMQDVLFGVIRQMQESGDISRDKDAEEIVSFLFIAARGVVFQWCLDEASYDLRTALHDYMALLIPVFETNLE